jgi:ABC-type Na+ efflux pump permease subunit
MRRTRREGESQGGAVRLWIVAGKLLIVLLILLLLLLVIPLGLGMAMGMCPTGALMGCPPAAGTCVAVTGLVLLLMLTLLGTVGDRDRSVPELLLDAPLERPPRSYR